jgi:ribosome-binding factor A
LENRKSKLEAPTRATAVASLGILSFDFPVSNTMRDAGWRVDRLADQIRGEVAGMIGSELKDPRIGFTTVTRVEVSHDLHRARVWVSVLGDEAAQQRTLEGLASAAGYVRREVFHRLRLHRVPDMIFVLDRSPEEASRMEALLQNLNSGGTGDSE